MPRLPADPEGFIRANTALEAPAMVPEFKLWLASEYVPIWQATEAWLEEQNVDPPYWAFCWPGGQAIARYLLKTLDGIDRPAIASVMPNQTGGFTTMLDLGANVDCSAEHLLQFAVMGSAYSKAMLGKQNPRVGVLSNGSEESKGTDLTRAAVSLIHRAAGIAQVTDTVVNDPQVAALRRKVTCASDASLGREAARARVVFADGCHRRRCNGV